MFQVGTLEYQGRKFVCTEEPILKSIDSKGVCSFYGFKELYICDPEKNEACLKKGCQQTCKYTFNKNFAKEADEKESDDFAEIIKTNLQS